MNGKDSNWPNFEIFSGNAPNAPASNTQYSNFNKTVLTFNYIRSNLSIVSRRYLFEVMLLNKTLKNIH